MDVVIDPRYRGPDASGNGGYASGVFARAAGFAPAQATLRLPPPLGVPLSVEEGRVLHGEALVAEVERATVDVRPPPPPSWEDARAAEHPDLDSPFPHCFVCGHARGPDGLHIHPGRCGDGVAATWTPREDTVGEEFVWSALDCPGGYATGAMDGRGVVVLGRFAVEVRRVPRAGERCVVVGRALARDGRKHDAVTAVYAGEELLGLARATWIEPRV